MIHFKDTSKNKTALSARWLQMSKQEQLIEKKKQEIQAKLEAQKQAAALAAEAKLSSAGTQDEKPSNNIFSNDGSFLTHFKKLLEKQKKEKLAKENPPKPKEIEKPVEKETKDVKTESKREETKRKETKHISKSRSSLPKRSSSQKKEFVDKWTDDWHKSDLLRAKEKDRNQRGRSSERKRSRWSDKSRNRLDSPPNRRDETNDKKDVFYLDDPVPNDFDKQNQWNMLCNRGDNGPKYNSRGPGSNDDGRWPRANLDGRNNVGPGHHMGPGPNMGQLPLVGNMPNVGHGSNTSSRFGPNMGPRGDMDSGPNNCPQPILGFTPLRNMGPGFNMPPLPNMSSASHMPPIPNISSSSNMPPLPNMNSVPNMPTPPNMSLGSNMGLASNSGQNPNMSQGSGFNMNSMPPFRGGSNYPNMPSPFMGTGGSNMMVPPGLTTSSGQSGNSGPPVPPFTGPFPNGPNGPPNPNMPLNNPSKMPFNPPFGSNFPTNNNQTFIPPNSMSGISIPPPIDQKARESSSRDHMPNIQPPMPLLMNQIPNPNNMDMLNVPPPLPPQTPQVLSADVLPPPVRRFADEVARNGDHWENVLKAVHPQELMWFLHNTNSHEYKMFREVVLKLRQDIQKQQEVRPEDKYEPEFSMEDEDSNDQKPIKQENPGDGYSQSLQPNWDDESFSNSRCKREPASSQSDDEDHVKERRKRKKKSRWGNEAPPADIKPPGVMAPLPPNFNPGMPPLPPNFNPGMPPLPPNMPPSIPSLMATPMQPPVPLPGMKLAKVEDEGMKLTNINRGNPALMQYAMTNFGTTNLSVEDWKKCEDNFKLNLLFQDMLKKRQEVEKLAAAGKHKYEYDSDEDTREGTWEHKLRSREMNATEKWADELTKQAAGKHHIGDFLPPEELKKFMEKYSAAKSGIEPNLSDYKEFKLKEDNVGFKMLQKLGWNEGQGLGAEGTGIVDPVNKGNQPVANLGLGAAVADNVSADDDEFDAYRKRMMLAYRFRPNPLNNPRRPYY